MNYDSFLLEEKIVSFSNYIFENKKYIEYYYVYYKDNRYSISIGYPDIKYNTAYKNFYVNICELPTANNCFQLRNHISFSFQTSADKTIFENIIRNLFADIMFRSVDRDELSLAFDIYRNCKRVESNSNTSRQSFKV